MNHITTTTLINKLTAAYERSLASVKKAEAKWEADKAVAAQVRANFNAKYDSLTSANLMAEYRKVMDADKVANKSWGLLRAAWTRKDKAFTKRYGV